MGRPKKYDREQVLERAMLTFWRKGYEATSTSDLEQQMGLNRSSLYAEFRSKHGLYEEALVFYLNHVVPDLIGELALPDAGLDTIDLILTRFASWAGTPGTEGGCMICNAATETATDDLAARSVVQRYVVTLQSGFLNALNNAVTAGELRGSLDTVAWSQKLATTLLGMMVLIRARVDPALARQAAKMASVELRANTPTGAAR